MLETLDGPLVTGRGTPPENAMQLWIRNLGEERDVDALHTIMLGNLLPGMRGLLDNNEALGRDNTRLLRWVGINAGLFRDNLRHRGLPPFPLDVAEELDMPVGAHMPRIHPGMLVSRIVEKMPDVPARN